MAFENPTFGEYQTFGGQADESTFKRFLYDAVFTVSAQTFKRSENPPETMHERVKRCICEIIDIKYSYSQAQDILPRGIGGITNDGYSVSRAARNTSSSVETTEQDDYIAACRKYLLMPVNLMYAGVGSRAWL